MTLPAKALATSLRPRRGIDSIMPYIPGEAEVEGVARVRKLSSNESPLGPSPRAMAAFNAVSASLERYPDAGSTVLRESLAVRYGLTVEQILCSCGSEEMLHLAARTFLDSGDEVIVSQYGFIAHLIATLACGGVPVKVPELDYHVDVDGMLAAITPQTKMVYLANPGNPTGTVLPLAEIRRLHAGVPPHVLLVVDAAYAEFAADRDDYGSGIELIREGATNLLVTRTFSKMHGLAGLRVGWAYGSPQVVDFLSRVRPAFNVNSAAQAAAVAALADEAHVRASLDLNRAGLETLTQGCGMLGLSTTRSIANFVLVHFRDPARSADAAYRFLKAQGILTRPVAGYGLPDSLRISIGTAADNAAVVDGLRDFLGAKQ